MTTRSGSNTDRLSWPGNTVVSRSDLVSAVMTTLFRTSGFPLTCQIAPVIEAVISTDVTVLHRSMPPWALIAVLSSSFMRGVLSAAFTAGRT
jgi:hypothetical protein